MRIRCALAAITSLVMSVPHAIGLADGQQGVSVYTSPQARGFFAKGRRIPVGQHWAGEVRQNTVILDGPTSSLLVGLEPGPAHGRDPVLSGQDFLRVKSDGTSQEDTTERAQQELVGQV